MPSSQSVHRFLEDSDDPHVTAGVPLLSDASLSADASSHHESKKRFSISGDSFNHLVHFTTMLGCFFGVLAAALTIGTTQFLVIGTSYVETTNEILINRLFLSFDILWCLVVTLAARQSMHLVMVRAFGISQDESNENSWQILDLSMAIGTLTGVLVSGAGISFFLGYGFWDKVIMIFGSIAMVVLCTARSFCLRKATADIVYLDYETTDELPAEKVVAV